MEPWMVELLDELSVVDAHSPEVAFALRKRADDLRAEQGDDAAVLDAVAAAFAYLHQERGDRDDPSEPYLAGQWKGLVGERWPPGLREVDEATLTVWEQAAAATSHPYAAARLHDVLFLAGHGDVHGHITAAVGAYLDQAAAAERGLDLVRALGRALEIAVQTKQDELAAQVAEKVVRAAEDSLDEDDPKPGVTLRLLRPLVGTGLADDLDRLLNRARERYSDDVWTTADLIDLQRQASDDPEARSDLDRQLVKSWLWWADQAGGMVRHGALAEAARLGGERGVTDLAAEAVRRLEAMTPDELGMQRIETPIQLPGDEIDRWVDRLLAQPDVVSALAPLAAGLPPSGSVEQNRRQVDENRSEFPLSAILPPSQLGYGAMPLYQPTNQEERDEFDLAQTEGISMQVWGPVFAHALQRIGEHHHPGEDDLTERLTDATPLDPGAARSLARALRHYWAGEHEAAAVIALPRVETLCRALLTLAGEALYRVQTGSNPGRYPLLENLLDRMAAHGLNEDWHRFLRTLLTSPGRGWNVRNDRLHGLVDDEIGPVVSALVLVAALYLGLHVRVQSDE